VLKKLGMPPQQVLQVSFLLPSETVPFVLLALSYPCCFSLTLRRQAFARTWDLAPSSSGGGRQTKEKDDPNVGPVRAELLYQLHVFRLQLLLGKNTAVLPPPSLGSFFPLAFLFVVILRSSHCGAKHLHCIPGPLATQAQQNGSLPAFGSGGLPSDQQELWVLLKRTSFAVPAASAANPIAVDSSSLQDGTEAATPMEVVVKKEMAAAAAAAGEPCALLQSLQALWEQLVRAVFCHTFIL
jgi:hypothetical protein